MLAIFHVGALDLLGRLEALRHLHAVADAAHIDLGGGGPLAGMKAFGVEDDVELALEFDDIALPERAGDDSHGEVSSIVQCARDRRRAQMSGHHTDLLAIRQRFSEPSDGGVPGARSVLMPSPFWALHAARRPLLLARMHIAAALREFFAARDFVEVETASLVVSPGNETHLHAFATEGVAPSGTRAP